jgi:hypothetical protein
MKKLSALICLTGLLIIGCSRPFEAALVDLTVLNSTMLSARYDSIMYHDSKRYLGHNIKVRGPYRAAEIDDTGVYRHYVLTKDGGGCCAGQFEFVMTGNGYPPENSTIELIGVFTQGTDRNGDRYYYLTADEFNVVG